MGAGGEAEGEGEEEEGGGRLSAVSSWGLPGHSRTARRLYPV